MSSCAKMEIVEINKDEKTRTVKFTKKNGKIKLINQKLHLKSNTWFEAICNDEAVKQFKNCPENKTYISEEQLSSSEEQSSSIQEEYSHAPASEFLF